MATLEKIRSKAGLLIVTIGIALLAFIVGDFLHSGQTYFRMSEDKVVDVNGEKISSGDFMKRVDEMTEVYKMQSRQNTLPNDMNSQIQQNVYESVVREFLIGEEADKIGMVVSKEELSDMIQGENISPMLQQIFRNPQTGAFDRTMLQGFLNHVLNTDASTLDGAAAEQLAQQRAFWMFWEKNIKDQRLENKYNTLLSKAIMPNKLDIQAAHEGSKVSADFAWARQSYSTIPDSTVTISQSDIKKLYSEQKNRFKQDEKRVVKYFIMDILPSEQDYKTTEENINKLKDEFITTNDIAEVVTMNSDVPYMDAFVAERSLPADVKTFVATAQVNDVEGPFMEDNTYKMFKLVARTSAPDSLKIRHIMLPVQDAKQTSTLTDSLVNALKGGADFKALAAKYSVDQSASTGGELGWITEASALGSIGEDFKNAAFSAAPNTFFTVKTMYGQHVVEVTERTANVPKVKVAQMIMAVNPSSQTINGMYNDINQYIAVNNDAAKFEKAAPEKGYNIVTNNELGAGDYSLGTIRDARQAVRWAFNNKKGAISEIFEIDGKFLVMALEDIIEKGYAPLAQVEPMLKSQLLVDKKAEQIINDLKAKGITTLDGYAEAMKSSIDTAKFVNFNTRRITGMGDEPVLSALAPLAPENKVEGPVKGKNGVYVFSVYQKNTSDVPFDAATQKQQLEGSNAYRVMYQAIEVLREKADIQDNRVKFF